jgi:hypothetical protein
MSWADMMEEDAVSSGFWVQLGWWRPYMAIHGSASVAGEPWGTIGNHGEAWEPLGAVGRNWTESMFLLHLPRESLAKQIRGWLWLARGGRGINILPVQSARGLCNAVGAEWNLFCQGSKGLKLDGTRRISLERILYHHFSYFLKGHWVLQSFAVAHLCWVWKFNFRMRWLHLL